jgi:hypothetical protein
LELGVIIFRLQSVRDWSGILFETEAETKAEAGGEKRYSGKPDGRAGTPRKNDKSRKTKD